MNSAVVGVGSNISPEENILRAEQEVAMLGRLTGKSSFYYTKPLGFEKQSDFLNGVFHIETSIEYGELKERLKKIENKLGRVRTENKFGPRTIDLDPVIFNNQIKDIDVFERDFIKNPVIELLPELSDTLSCSNYQNHFPTIHEIIEKILSLLPELPVSVFGAGQWFCDRESPVGDIGIFVIVENILDKYEKILNQELRKPNLEKIESYPVRLRLFHLEEPEEKPSGKSSAAPSQNNTGSFISQSPSQSNKGSFVSQPLSQSNTESFIIHSLSQRNTGSFISRSTSLKLLYGKSLPV